MATSVRDGSQDHLSAMNRIYKPLMKTTLVCINASPPLLFESWKSCRGKFARDHCVRRQNIVPPPFGNQSERRNIQRGRAHPFTHTTFLDRLLCREEDLDSRIRKLLAFPLWFIKPTSTILTTGRPVKLVYPVGRIYSYAWALGLPVRKLEQAPTVTVTWHSSESIFNSPTLSPISRTAFINLVCPVLTTRQSTHCDKRATYWRTLSHPSCFPATEGIRCTFTLDQSHFRAKSSIDWRGRTRFYTKRQQMTSKTRAKQTSCFTIVSNAGRTWTASNTRWKTNGNASGSFSGFAGWHEGRSWSQTNWAKTLVWILQVNWETNVFYLTPVIGDEVGCWDDDP